MKYKAIYADVDGTLIAPNAHFTTRASEKTIKAVRDIGKLGIKFSIATARSLDWIYGLTESLDISSPLILDNGSKIYDWNNKKYLSEYFIEENKIVKILNFLTKLHPKVYFVNNDKRFIFDHKKHQDFSKVTKIMILHIDPKKAHKISTKIKDNLGIKATKSISGHNPLVESLHITHKLATKENALEKVVNYLGYKFSEIIGIGDSYNDIGFLKKCGLKIAMDNSVFEVKALADYIAPSYDKDGVAKVLEKFILNK